MAIYLSEKVQKWMTFVGGFLMLLPNGVTWYWGNVSIYVYSYFHHKNTTTHQDVKAPWLLSLYVISWSSAMMVAGHINNKIGRRLTIAMGIALFDAGLMSSYFVFSDSKTLLDITMGILGGFGNGLIHTMVLQTVVDWTTSRVGLVTAGLFTSYAIGSVVINQIITHYINPENKKVDVIIGKTHYFSQQDILDKVPSMFLALFTCSAVFHFVGFLFLRLKHNQIGLSPVTKIDDDQQSIERGLLTDTDKILPTSGSSVKDLGNIHDVSSCEDESMNCPSEWLVDGNDTKSTSFKDNTIITLHQSTSEKTPCQVLRSWLFYILWFTMIGSDSAYMTLSNYYKIFGQVWIKDDHFLTNLGTSLAIFTVGMRLLWGLLADVVGVKSAIITLSSGLSLICVGYYFTAHLNKWLFFVATLIYACLTCGVYVNFIVAVHNLYGKVNFTNNWGLLASSTIVLNLIFPPITQTILSHFGWFALFFSISAINFVSLLLTVCSFPE